MAESTSRCDEHDPVRARAQTIIAKGADCTIEEPVVVEDIWTSNVGSISMAHWCVIYWEVHNPNVPDSCPMCYACRTVDYNRDHSGH